MGSFNRVVQKDNLTDVLDQSANSSGNNPNPGTVTAPDGSEVTLGLQSGRVSTVGVRVSTIPSSSRIFSGGIIRKK